MIHKFKIFYIVFCYFVFLLFCSCSKGNLKDITTKNGLYVYSTNKELVNGDFLGYFDDGKVSCSVNFKNGIPIGEYKSYGYQGEIIATSKYSSIIKVNNQAWQKNHIVRLTITDSKEGEYQILDLSVVFKQKPSLSYPELTTEALRVLENNGVDVKKFETIYFCIGELEHSFFEIKTSNIGK